MIKFSKIILFFITLFLILGCSSKVKEEIMGEELREELSSSNNPILQKTAFEIIEVNAENFHISKSEVPDKENIHRVKIMGAELHNVISLLTEATSQDVIFQLQSDAGRSNSGQNSVQTNGQTNGQNVGSTGASYQIRQSKVYVSASDVGFGRLLKKAVGDKLSIRYDDDTYYLGYTKTVTVKVPALRGLFTALRAQLATLGATHVIHNAISSSVTFTAKEKEYLDIMNYLEILRNNLYVIEYDIAIYNVDLKDKYSLGINWDIIHSNANGLSFQAQSAANAGTGAISGVPATISAIMDVGKFNINMIADALKQFGKVESIQRPTLLGLAGTDVTLVDGLEEPYIKSLTTTAIGDTGVKTSTESATALSGLKVTLNSNIMDETVLTDIQLDINDIVGYSDFEVDGTKYSQPRTQTKIIRNSIRVQPGVPIVISGLFRHEIDKGYKGIPGLAETSASLLGGNEYEGITKSEMVIIVTPRVIKYVVK